MHFISAPFSSFVAYCWPQDEMNSASEKYNVKTRGAVERGTGRSPLIQLLVYLLTGSIITYRNSVDGSLSVIRLS